MSDPHTQLFWDRVRLYISQIERGVALTAKDVPMPKMPDAGLRVKDLGKLVRRMYGTQAASDDDVMTMARLMKFGIAMSGEPDNPTILPRGGVSP